MQKCIKILLFHTYMKLNMFRATRRQCSFRLLMMGGVSSETYWASHKVWNKNFDTVASCWIFFVNYTMMHGSMNIKHNALYFCTISRCGFGRKNIAFRNCPKLPCFLYSWQSICIHCSQSLLTVLKKKCSLKSHILLQIMQYDIFTASNKGFRIDVFFPAAFWALLK